MGSGSGVNFLQNDWGTEVEAESVLAGAAESLTTWFPPSAQDYVFIIGGAAAAGDEERSVEQRIESRIASLRQAAPTGAVLQEAIRDVQDALIFDVQTTEDAAHQLAFFDGLGALDTLLDLPRRVAAVSAADVQRAAVRYLGPDRRSIAWHLPIGNTESAIDIATDARPAVTPDRPRGVPGTGPADQPVATTLSGGTPVIVQRSDLSPTAFLQIVLPSNRIEGAVPDVPILGYSSITYELRPQQVDDAIAQAARALEALKPREEDEHALTNDPAMLMEQTFADITQVDAQPPGMHGAVSLITVTGDVDADRVLAQLEASFGALAHRPLAVAGREPLSRETLVLHTGKPVAQAQLGYIATAPGPRQSQSEAWRLLLYILSHDYEGRLGKKAISESGLAYYIGSEYRSDGTNAWISLSTGVDTNKIAPLRELLAAELERLASEPPTDAEILEAKSNRLGRLASSAQSNAELAAQLATQWLWYGELPGPDSLRERLDATSRQDVLDAVRSFVSGKTIVITE